MRQTQQIMAILLLLAQSLAGQELKSIAPQKLSISYDKTLHILFDSNIQYFNRGVSDIAVSVDQAVPNILRIKANVEDFKNETNISVVTKSGAYHTFDIIYSASLKNTMYQMRADTMLEAIPSVLVDINDSKSTHLIFPDAVKYIDFGNNESISVAKAVGTGNIIKLQGLQAGFPETNLTIVTGNNEIFSYNVVFNQTPKSHSFKIGDITRNMALFEEELPNEHNINEDALKALHSSRRIFYAGIEKARMSITLNNIFIKNNILFYVLEIANKSNIDFNIEFLKYSITDMKQHDNTSVQEDEIIPVFNLDQPEKIKGKQKCRFVAVLPGFTIPDRKILNVELFEKNGGRNLKFSLKNKEIIAASEL